MHAAVRSAAIPIDYLVAEMAAIPIGTRAALELRVEALDPDLGGVTGELWRRAENELVSAFPGVSIDELTTVRDLVWFGPGVPRRVPLHGYLRRISREYLDLAGAWIRPRVPPGSPEHAEGERADGPLARRSWLWLGFCLPDDLLSGALGGHSPPLAVTRLSPVMRGILRERRFAESHLHVGAAIRFPAVWALLHDHLGRRLLSPTVFNAPGADFDEGVALGPMFARAAVARYVTSAYLASGTRCSLYRWLHSDARDAVESAISPSAFGTLLRVLHDVVWTPLATPVRDPDLVPPSVQDDLPRAGIRWHRRGTSANATTEFATVMGLYAELTRSGAVPAPSRLADVDRADPICGHHQRDHLSTSEQRFLGAALAHLEHGDATGCRDTLFTTLFWQVVRTRTLVYRHVTQRPLTPGLQWFVRHYARASRARGHLSERVKVEAALDIGGLDEGLRSLEIRTAPDDNRSDLLRLVKDVASVARHVNDRARRPRPGGDPECAGGDHERLDRETGVEIGVVLHFIKDRGGGIVDGTPTAAWRQSNADPGADCNSTGFRFSHVHEQVGRKARAVAGLFGDWPLSLYVIRGIDICTDELGVPNWVFRSAFTQVRRAADRAAIDLARANHPRLRKPLHTTIHAGEDFVHLQTGLQTIDRLISDFALGEGDRLGHGVALGVSPEQWCQRAGRVPLAREDRIVDLVWEWVLYGQRRAEPSQARRAYLDREIHRLVSDWWGDDPPGRFELEQLAVDLANPTRMMQAGFPDRRPVATDDRTRRLHRYLTDRNLFDRGREPVWVDVGAEVETLVLLQNAVRRRVADAGITVEINPTSNLLIADLADLEHHPLWRLNPPGPRLDDFIPVSVVVGSDDPVVFNCTLPEEFQLLHDTLRLAGLGDQQSLDWVDRARDAGLDSRFTLDRPLPHDFNAVVGSRDVR